MDVNYHFLINITHVLLLYTPHIMYLDICLSADFLPCKNNLGQILPQIHTFFVYLSPYETWKIPLYHLSHAHPSHPIPSLVHDTEYSHLLTHSPYGEYDYSPPSLNLPTQIYPMDSLPPILNAESDRPLSSLFDILVVLYTLPEHRLYMQSNDPHLTYHCSRI